MSVRRTVLAETDENFLVGLHAMIWEPHESWDRFRGTVKSAVVKRPLTIAERNKVAEIFRRGGLIFEPGSGRFGFGVCIYAFKPGEVAGYVHQAPTLVIKLDSHHLNKEDNAYTREVAYKWIEEFTHSTENRAQRAAEGFTEALQPMAHYDY